MQLSWAVLRNTDPYFSTKSLELDKIDSHQISRAQDLMLKTNFFHHNCMDRSRGHKVNMYVSVCVGPLIRPLISQMWDISVGSMS